MNDNPCTYTENISVIRCPKIHYICRKTSLRIYVTVKMLKGYVPTEFWFYYSLTFNKRSQSIKVYSDSPPEFSGAKAIRQMTAVLHEIDRDT